MGKRACPGAARQQLDTFPSGVYLVSPSRCQTEHIIPGIAEHMRHQPQQDAGEPKRQVPDYLCNKHMPLVMAAFQRAHAAPGRV
jgi:hypothetical protein